MEELSLFPTAINGVPPTNMINVSIALDEQNIGLSVNVLGQPSGKFRPILEDQSHIFKIMRMSKVLGNVGFSKDKHLQHFNVADGFPVMFYNFTDNEYFTINCFWSHFL